MITFVYDRVVDGVGYPNLARHQARPFTPEWRMFDHHWPRTVPLRLLLYLTQAGIPYQTVSVTDGKRGWYPIGLGWFDHDFDYIGAVPESVRRCLGHDLRLLFWYHEGDNPMRIKHRLDALCQQHQLTSDCYRFVSANTMARHMPGYVYFADHECFFRYVNRRQHHHALSRPSRVFTVLSRTPKWWRASCMSDLQHHGVLDQSTWSYNSQSLGYQDQEIDNPLQLDSRPGWRSRTKKFASMVKSIPGDDVNHNDHHWVNTDLFHDSQCNIVLETHFDADQSGGTFLTEKTYKCIKYAQPFVLAAPAGSLQELRNQGYRVFDHGINNDYDLIVDNTQRWQAVLATVLDIQQRARDPGWWQSCRIDLEHNQQRFNQRLTVAIDAVADWLGQDTTVT